MPIEFVLGAIAVMNFGMGFAAFLIAHVLKMTISLACHAQEDSYKSEVYANLANVQEFQAKFVWSVSLDTLFKTDFALLATVFNLIGTISSVYSAMNSLNWPQISEYVSLAIAELMTLHCQPAYNASKALG